MSQPSKQQQIITAHAAFICQVVQFSQNAEHKPALESLLKSARDSGWSDLERAIRLILKGQRDMSAIKGLDEEDHIIAETIMRGLQDPATLPNPDEKPGPAMAAPGLAHMIHSAATGNAQALVILGNMAEQMSRAGGDMARVAAVIRPILNGERNTDKLSSGLTSSGEQLVLGILEELEKLELH
jgi:hypothetical protein